MKLTINFKLEKKTKNTGRYQEIDNNDEPSVSPLVGTVYVQKSALGDPVPQILQVTIESL
jgi:hypothetical protein